MMQAVAAEPVPLSLDNDRVIRVVGTRVPLETLVLAFDAGATAEEIAQDYPVLELDDVYAVITYYLRHREEVADYLDERRAWAGSMREKCQARFPTVGLRDRLLARLERRRASTD